MHTLLHCILFILYMRLISGSSLNVPSLLCRNRHRGVVGGVYGSVDLGYYYVDIYVGTPPVKQTVIVDTGSTLTAFPCTGCINCGSHIDPWFDPNQSSSYK